MSKTAMIRARVEPDLKRDAEQVFDKLGLSPTQAVTLFYRQVTLRQGIPFDVAVPRATPEAAGTGRHPYVLDDPDIVAAWVAEAERRYEAYRAGRMKGIPADEVLASAREELT